MAQVIIDSGPVDAEDQLRTVPESQWRELMRARRSFLAVRLPHDCRCLLEFADDAEKMWAPLGFADVEDFIKHGLDLDPQQVAWAVDGLKRMEPDKPARYDKAIELGQKYRQLDATTPDLLEPHRPKKLRDVENVTKLSGTDDTSYALARLRRDRSDIHARVLDGELTAHAGMIEAGFRKKQARRAGPTPLDKIRRALTKCSDDDLRALIDEIELIIRERNRDKQLI